MTIAQEINDLKSRVSAAFSACEEKSASMPASRTTWTLADTIRTIPTGGSHEMDDSLIEGTSTYYENSRVSTIGQGVFAYNKTLTSVNFPNVETIESEAFYYAGITNASFPKLKTIGTSGFAGASISNIFQVFSNVEIIGSSAFRNCKKLTPSSVFYFPNVTSIGVYAFFSCSSAFYNRITKLDLPKVRTIGSYMFSSKGYSNITEVNLPMLQKVDGLFCTSAKITSLDLPELTTITSTYVFSNCSLLQQYSLPKLQYAYHICIQWPISYLYLPNLEQGGFIGSGCTNLTTISLPKFYSVINYLGTIGQQSPNLVSIYFKSPSMQSVSTMFLSYLSNPDLKIFVPTSLVTYYQNLGGFSSRASQIYPFDDWEE